MIGGGVNDDEDSVNVKSPRIIKKLQNLERHKSPLRQLGLEMVSKVKVDSQRDSPFSLRQSHEKSRSPRDRSN